jgi:general stress protein YciG
MIAKHGSREAVKEFMQGIGAKGGKNGKTGGFACQLQGKDGLTGKERARYVGQKGGRISRRTKKY